MTPILLSLFISAVSASAAPSADTQAATLKASELVRQAIKRSPQIKSSEAELRESEATTSRYRAALFPTVTAKASATSQEDSTTFSSSEISVADRTSEVYTAYLEAKQPLFTGGGLLGGLRLRKKEEQIAQLKYLVAKQSAVASAMLSFYSIRELEALLTAAIENEQILSEYERTISRYTRIGRARKTDLLQAQVNLLTAQSEVRNLEAKIKRENQNLRSTLGLETTVQIDASSRTDETIQMPNIDQAVATALTSNPELIITQLNFEKTSDEKVVELAPDMPSLNLTGKLGYQSPDQPNLFESSSEFNSVTLQLDVPLFSGLSSLARRREITQRTYRRERDLETFKIELDASVRSLLEEVSAHEARYTLAQKASDSARLALRSGNADYQQGLISSQDLVSLQRTRYDAERLKISSQNEVARSVLSLRKTLGNDLEATYGK